MTISLAFLAPDLVKAAVEGRLPHGIGVARLRDAPAEWSRQYAMLGLLISDRVWSVGDLIDMAGMRKARMRKVRVRGPCVVTGRLTGASQSLSVNPALRPRRFSHTPPGPLRR